VVHDKYLVFPETFVTGKPCSYWNRFAHGSNSFSNKIWNELLQPGVNCAPTREQYTVTWMFSPGRHPRAAGRHQALRLRFTGIDLLAIRCNPCSGVFATSAAMLHKSIELYSVIEWCDTLSCWENGAILIKQVQYTNRCRQVRRLTRSRWEGFRRRIGERGTAWLIRVTAAARGRT
jgi:hypothetical protein